LKHGSMFGKDVESEMIERKVGKRRYIGSWERKGRGGNWMRELEVERVREEGR